MLKRVFVKAHVIIIVIRICEELILDSKNITRRHVVLWKEKPFGFGNGHDLVAFVSQVLALLVAKVGVHILVADDLEWLLDPDRSVVGGDNHARFAIRYFFQYLQQRRVNEPGFG